MRTSKLAGSALDLSKRRVLPSTRLLVAAKRVLAWNEKTQYDLHVMEDPYGTCWTASEAEGNRALAFVELRLAVDAVEKGLL